MAQTATAITDHNTIFIWSCLKTQAEEGEWDNNLYLKHFRANKELALPVIQASLEELREKGFATMRLLVRGTQHDTKVYFPIDTPVSLTISLPKEDH